MRNAADWLIREGRALTPQETMVYVKQVAPDAAAHWQLNVKKPEAARGADAGSN